MNQRKRFIAIGLIVVAAVLIGFVVVRQNSSNGGFKPQVQISTDPDTGEQIRKTNNTPEAVGSNTSVTILGASSVERYVSETQLSLFKDNLYVYLSARHSSEGLNIKILPETVRDDTSIENQEFIAGTFLIEKSNKRIDFRLELIRANGINITYTDSSNKQNPTYKSGPVIFTAEDEFFGGGDDLDGAPPGNAQ